MFKVCRALNGMDVKADMVDIACSCHGGQVPCFLLRAAMACDFVPFLGLFPSTKSSDVMAVKIASYMRQVSGKPLRTAGAFLKSMHKEVFFATERDARDFAAGAPGLYTLFTPNVTRHYGCNKACLDTRAPAALVAA